MDQDPLEFLENSTYKNEWKERNSSKKKKFKAITILLYYKFELNFS